MKNKIQYIFIMVLLSACTTPYQKFGTGAVWEGFGGYDENKVGKDSWNVGYTATKATTRRRMTDFALRRAKELCAENGKKDFELVSKDYADIPTLDGASHRVMLLINCK